MRLALIACSVGLALIGCISLSSSDPPPPERTTVVTPQGTQTVCHESDGERDCVTR